MRRTRAAAILAILSVLFAFATTRAAKADELPLIASGGGPKQGWVAIEFSQAPGGQGALSVRNDNVSGAGFVSLYLYDVSNRTLGGGNVGILGNLGDVHYEVNVPPVPAAAGTVPSTRSVPYGGIVNMPFDSNSLPAGTYKALFIASGAGTGWSWSLRGNSAVSAPSASTSGSDVYAYSSKDFSGPVSAQAYAGFGGVPSTGAAASLNAARSITASHSLVGMGFFGSGLAGRVSMTMQGPTGSQSCTCTLGGVTGPEAAGPGTWTFTYTGVGAGTSNIADVLLGVADVYLP